MYRLRLNKRYGIQFVTLFATYVYVILIRCCFESVPAIYDYNQAYSTSTLYNAYVMHIDSLCYDCANVPVYWDFKLKFSKLRNLVQLGKFPSKILF